MKKIYGRLKKLLKRKKNQVVNGCYGISEIYDIVRISDILGRAEYRAEHKKYGLRGIINGNM